MKNKKKNVPLVRATSSSGTPEANSRSSSISKLLTCITTENSFDLNVKYYQVSETFFSIDCPG